MPPLWNLGYRLFSIGTKWLTLANDLANVLVLGEWLSLPFYGIALVFYEAADFCWDANRVVQDIRVFVDRLVYQGGVNDLIQAVFGYWYRFRTDPYGFVNQIVSYWFPDWNTFRNNPRGFINQRLNDLWSEWNWFRLHPVDWLRYKIEVNLGLGIGFFDDPAWTLRLRLYGRFPLLRGLFDDPPRWFRNRIATPLGISALFFDAPVLWFWNQLRNSIDNYLESHVEWLIDVVARMVNRVWVTKI